MNVPKNIVYTKEHEWIKVDGDRAYLGITDFAQEHMGDIVFVELPEVDAEVSPEEAIAVVESVKAVSSVYSPVTGTVLEVNEELESSPELLNQDPYGNWITILSISDESELKQLMSAEDYEAFCKEQE